MRLSLGILLLCFGLATSPSAFAHNKSQSASTWQAQGNSIIAVFSVDARRATQLHTLYPDAAEDSGALLLRHLREAVTLSQAPGGACALTAGTRLAAYRDVERVELQFECSAAPSSAVTTLSFQAFFSISPNHIHYVRVGDGSGRQEAVLTTGQREMVLFSETVAGESPSSFGDFVSVGILHVTSGLDHIVFLVALLMLVQTVRTAVIAITGFTLGHTISLAGVTLGIVTVDAALIEAIIGFTVAYTAFEAFSLRYGVENRLGRRVLFALLVLLLAGALLSLALPFTVLAGILLFCAAMLELGPERAQKGLILVTAAFGLAHGAGFAGAMQSFDVPTADLLPMLFGFNIGVEVAQLIILAVTLLVIAVQKRLLPKAQAFVQAQVTPLILVTIFGLGIFWFASRLMVPGAG